MKFLGVHPFGHDSCVVLLDTNKKLISTYTLERFTRVKHDMRYVLPQFFEKIDKFNPHHIAFASEECRPKDIIMFQILQSIYLLSIKQRKTLLTKFELIKLYINKLKLRLLIYLRSHETQDDMKSKIKLDFNTNSVSLNDHHDCHAYSALLSSSMWNKNNVLVITIDGQGDNACASISISREGKVLRKITISNDHSLAILFSYFTEVAGFNPNADEGKLEALACYHSGIEPELYKALNSWIKVDRETLKFNFTPSKSFPFNSIPGNRRKIISLLKKYYKNMKPESFAYSMQQVFEEKYLEWIIAAKDKYKAKFLCLAGGGVANVKLNLRVFEEGGFEGMHIFPAMGDDGVAFGAAVKSAHMSGENIDFIRQSNMPFFGDIAPKKEIEETLIRAKKENFKISGPYTEKKLTDIVSSAIGRNKICAVFRGASEYGPRALGHRSILANPIDPKARDTINNKFKKREWFQPFCPIMTVDEAKNILISFYQNRHMTCAFRVKSEFAGKIPSVVHVDNTARAQIIDRSDEPFIYDLLISLKSITGFSVLLNTSFNLHGRAMVNCPEHALNDFIDCGLDMLILENYIISR